MIDTELFKRISDRIDTYENEMIELQKSLTAIPALAPESGGEGEHDKARFLVEYLRSRGFDEINVVNAPDERVSSGVRSNIIAFVPGSNMNKTIWILSHIDVVPPGELGLWDAPPYEGYVKDGRVFGRGTEDNQQDLVASLFAAKALIDEGLQPEFQVGLAFVADEETGSTKGLEYLLEERSDLFKKDDLIIVPDFGNPEGTLIEIAEKSILWLRIKTKGLQCHASRPEAGNNAFRAASHLIVALDGLYDSFDRTEPLYHPPVSTFEPTKKDGNVPNVNTIPGEDVFFLDCRVLPFYDLKEVLAEIRTMADAIEDKFGVTIEITPVQMVQAPPPTDEEAPVVEALKEAIEKVYRISAVPGGIGGGTVAAHFRVKRYPVAVWSKLDSMAHQPNESCRIENMIGNAKVFAHIMMRKE